jgi:hypothetical protein
MASDQIVDIAILILVKYKVIVLWSLQVKIQEMMPNKTILHFYEKLYKLTKNILGFVSLEIYDFDDILKSFYLEQTS